MQFSRFILTLLPITQSAMVIYGVITEPGEHTTNVSLYGIESSGSRNWVVVTVDFDPIFSRDCGDDDYYDWLPWDDVRFFWNKDTPSIRKPL